jgi:hypothetical protein
MRSLLTAKECVAKAEELLDEEGAPERQEARARRAAVYVELAKLKKEYGTL